MRVNHILLSHKTVGALFSTVKENPNKIIRNLFNFVGVKETKNLVMQCRKDEINLWLKAFYEEFPESYINKSTCTQLIEYMKNVLNSENTRIISVFSLKKYKTYDSEIIKTISNINRK